jgi:hypothetical protein
MNTTITNTRIKLLAASLAAGALGAAIAFAPIAAATTATTTQTGPAAAGADPLVPFGTDPYVPYRLGYINPNHDEGTFPNGEVDLPF